MHEPEAADMRNETKACERNADEPEPQAGDEPQLNLSMNLMTRTGEADIRYAARHSTR
jgi:hypothetical protein